MMEGHSIRLLLEDRSFFEGILLLKPSYSKLGCRSTGQAIELALGHVSSKKCI